MSLQKIYAIIFGKKISKSQRLSNWEAPQLSVPQQYYAALDAWACLHIYDALQEGAKFYYTPENQQSNLQQQIQ
jgi:ribonuclease D